MAATMNDLKNRWRTRVTLNGLLSACIDEQIEYASAALAMDAVESREELARRGRTRAGMALTLEARIRALGGEPWGGPTLRSSLRRSLRAVRALVQGRLDAPRLLRDCARLEEETERRYTAALGRVMPESVRTLLASQLAEISAGRRTSLPRAAE
jgi:uncharacterized protein (TIGR02284 family)